jgi:2-oxoglutarate ferredoxin oxidoreductase subunit beta
MSIVHKYLRTNKKFPHVWCSGCSDGIVLAALARAIHKLQLPRDDVVLVSGIGCSSRAPVYVDFNTLHTTHGRALPFATGVKIANPNLHLIIITGDGDAMAIGGNHFIHTCRRNIDMTAIVFNNYIYGMTGGQVSPTTPFGKIASTSPYGSTDNPMPVCEVAIAAGATFVARATAYHARQLDMLIEKGIKHKGFSVIEVMSTCPTIYGRLNKLGKPTEMLLWQKSNAMSIQTWQKLPTEEEKQKAKEEKIITGIMHEIEKPEYTEEYQKLIDRYRTKEFELV